jgi:chemotaxis response regulator CheB
MAIKNLRLIAAFIILCLIGTTVFASVGGKIIVEDESTAVIPGMPQATIATGIVHYVLPLHEVASLITSLAGTL